MFNSKIVWLIIGILLATFIAFIPNTIKSVV